MSNDSRSEKSSWETSSLSDMTAYPSRVTNDQSSIIRRVDELIRVLAANEGNRKGTFATGSLTLSIGEADELLRELRGLRSSTSNLQAEVDRLNALINTPELADFTKGVTLEAAHQVERWGEAHDRSKSAENWYWLVGYLAGKALRASITGDMDKARHHTISAGAALLNWHKAINRDTSGAGVGQDEDLAALDSSSATSFKYLVRSGGECPQDWLCKDIPEVQAALCEALYGRAEDADAHEIGKYLAQVQGMTVSQRDLKYTYEDGWLEIIRVSDSLVRK